MGLGDVLKKVVLPVAAGAFLGAPVAGATHIFEQREKGHSPLEAIVRGLHGTG